MDGAKRENSEAAKERIGPDIHALGEGLFKPENIAYKEAPKAKIEAKPVNVAPVASKDVKEEDYLKEIEELRRRLREKEEECKHFHCLCQLILRDVCLLAIEE